MTNDQANAASLLETAIDLIRQVLIKHETAVMAEFRAIIEAKNHELKLIYAERDEANAKGHRAVTLTMEGEDRERRLATSLLRAEKERDIVVGVLTQVRCYIDSPRFDEEGEVTELVDDILKRIP